MKKNKPVILVILDGFGASPVQEGNAILAARMPYFDNLLANYPKVLLHASAAEVGLEIGEVGNSEVGHLNLGTGRITLQSLSRINEAIANKSFFANQSLNNACKFVCDNNSTLHLLGLASNGGVHSHIDHLLNLLILAKEKGVKKVSIHLITDGRDTEQKCALKFVDLINNQINKLGIGQISTISGRFYAMDRDKNWDRIKLAYDAIVNNQGKNELDVKTAINNSYKNGENDENITPIVLKGSDNIKDNDAVIFYNFRQDRAQELAATLVEENFNNFSRGQKKNIFFSGFVSYGDEPNTMTQVAFFQPKIENQLASILSTSNFTQLHAAETEKYAHVTYFFNGGQEQPFTGEERILVASPKVKSYDQKPEMSLNEVTDSFLINLKKKMKNFAVINFANADMVGHTGNYQQTTKACETIDSNLAKIIQFADQNQINLLVVADHGNAEQMINPLDQSIDKNHTTNPVPFILVGSDFKNSQTNFSIDDKMAFFASEPVGVIADVAPTIIDLLGVMPPSEMNGQSLKELI